MTKLSNFNVRVYTILYSKSRNSILLSAEQYGNFQLIKFPGGGLEFGEGPIDCIQREFQEEFNISLNPNHLQPFYFTQSCIPSFLQNEDQVVLLYYLLNFDLNPLGQFSNQPNFFLPKEFTPGQYWLEIDPKNQPLLSSAADQECFRYLLNELK